MVESIPFAILDGLPSLYGLKYDSAIACGLLLYLCFYKLDGSSTHGGYTFLLVAIDTFTKWVEAEPVGCITKENTVKFLHGIVMHFDVLNRLISDNGTQFISKKFENFYAAYGIKHPRCSVNHSTTNENVEQANGIILQGIKT